MKKLYCTTFTGDETYFYIDIVETGWIYDVFLILTYEVKNQFEDGEYIKIPAKYSCKTTLNGKAASRFEVYYAFEKPAKFMASYFIYTIEEVTYVTEEPVCFAVEEGP